MSSNRVSNLQGFTLIELLITLAVLSFGLLGLAGLQVGMVRANAFNKDLTIANSIGADLIEEAKAARWQGGQMVLFIPDPKDAVYPPPYGDTNGDGVVDRDLNGDGNADDPYGRRFTWTRTVTYDPSGGRFATVDVSVFWPNPGQPRPHQSDVRTVIGRR